MHICCFKKKTVWYNQSSYVYQYCEICNIVNTEPEIKLDLDVYDTGHYAIKSYKLIPLLINSADYCYILYILRKRGINANSSILDFGCGKGFFLFSLKMLGYKRIFGLETSQPRAHFASNLIKSSVSNEYYNGGLIMGKQFDVITLIHVLEHISNPFDFLDKIIKGASCTNGKIFIEVPNYSSISSKVAKLFWAHFTPHFHINHFSITTFEFCCKELGLDFEVVSTFSFYNGTMGMMSAILSLFGYRSSLFEDLKSRRSIIVVSFLLLFPIAFILELFVSLIFNRGSVLKILIFK
jgi:SAM-dependent methyltransferase